MCSKNTAEDPQIIVPAQVKESKTGGGEIIVFQVFLGPFSIVCIVPIPEDNSDKTNVYVKLKVHGQQRRIIDKEALDVEEPQDDND
jgi:hypothetical protein